MKITKRDLKIFIPNFLALFSSAFSITMLFPFLPFMIKFLLPKLKEEDIGKYAGFIAASLFLGRFFGSYVWGALADKKGRKPVMIASCLLIGIFSAAFGFSVELYMAIIFRFCVGLFNGVVGTAKAVIAESSTDRTQALGMSLIMGAFSLGLVIGPAVSGALADPIGQYNLTISDPVVRGFLTKFPFSLPCLVNLLLCIVAAVSVAVFMPETLGAEKSKKQAVDSGHSSSQSNSVTDDKQELLADDAACEPNSEMTQCDTDLGTVYGSSSNLLTEHQDGHASGDDGGDEIEPLVGGATTDDGLINERGCGEEGDTSESPRRKLSSASRRGSFLVPFFNRRASFTPSFFRPPKRWHSRRDRSAENGVQRLVFEEEESGLGQEIEMEGGGDGEEGGGEGGQGGVATAKWTKRLKASLKKTLLNLKLFFTTRATLLSLLIYCIFSFAIIGFDEVYSLWAATPTYLGGLGWTLHEIGISQAISGLLFFFFTFLFPVLERRFGLVAVFQMSSSAIIICIMLLPNVHLIPAERLNPLRWCCVILLFFIARVTIGYNFTAVSMFINNSVTFDKLGEVNGLGVSLTGMLRTIAPVFGGSIFSVSLSKRARQFGFPINYHLIFIIFSSIVFACTAMAACLPASINRQKVVTSDSDSIDRSENSVSTIRTDEEASSSSGNGDSTSV